MFSNLSERLQRTLKSLKGQARLTDENMSAALREVRIALLEADVALPVAKQFLETLKEAAKGQDVAKAIDPGQQVIKIVNDALVDALGKEAEPLDLEGKPPIVILMSGLQGSGKTTTTAKLGKLLSEKNKKKVMVTSCDVYRPAAIEQLEKLATELSLHYHPADPQSNPLDIAKAALSYAKTQYCDVLIVDTAGRLHVDSDMMADIQALHHYLQPRENLFVVDSMTGQDAANTAKVFNETLPLTGIILTKTDGDARGGAALSISHITGKPIKFIGTGEKMDGLEAFYPDRIASRILGMGDIVSLVEEAEQKLDQDKQKKLAKKLKKGGFDLEDFRDQIAQMDKMGGIMGMLGKLPGMNKLPAGAEKQMNDKKFVQITAMINSMTPSERRHPTIINPSRKKRIAKGAGTEPQEVGRLLKQFEKMQKMMKKLKKAGGLGNLMGMLK